MTNQNLNSFPPEKIHVVLTQIAREELARIFREQNAASDLDDHDIDQRIALLDETRQTLKGVVAWMRLCLLCDRLPKDLDQPDAA